MNKASLHKRVWGWYFFDWASQPYSTLLVTFVFAPYFASVVDDHFMRLGMDHHAAAAKAQSMWSWCLAICGLLVGFGAPLIGAIADSTGQRKLWVAGFSVLLIMGATGTWSLSPDGSNAWTALIWFGTGFVGAEFALIFTNAQLPSLGTKEDIGRISGLGFAFGYLGGLVALAIMLLFFMEQSDGKTLLGLAPAFGLDPDQHEGTRIAGPFSAIWYIVFMVPYFLWVKDDVRANTTIRIKTTLNKLGSSLRNLQNRKSLSFFLLSSMLYRDALNGLYSFGGVYAKLVLEWSIVQVGIFGIVGGVTAVIFCIIGGRLDARFGPRPVIMASVIGLVVVCAVIIGMSREQFFGIVLAPDSILPDAVFYICGGLIGGLGGILQAASRSLMTRHTDLGNSTENFGLYGLSGRATAFLAPFLIGVATTLSGSARMGLLPVLGLFLLGLILLRWVHVEGDRGTWISELKH